MEEPEVRVDDTVADSETSEAAVVEAVDTALEWAAASSSLEATVVEEAAHVLFSVTVSNLV